MFLFWYNCAGCLDKSWPGIKPEQKSGSGLAIRQNKQIL